jgi:uncharacterized membrane protein
MERWYKLNLGFGLFGILIFIASMMFFKKMPLFLLPAMFGIGITFKSLKNIYKNEQPTVNKKSKKFDYSSTNRKKNHKNK